MQVQPTQQFSFYAESCLPAVALAKAGTLNHSLINTDPAHFGHICVPFKYLHDAVLPQSGHALFHRLGK